MSASRTEGRLTSSRRARSRSGGRRAPGLYSPRRISRAICSAMRRYSRCGSTALIGMARGGAPVRISIVGGRLDSAERGRLHCRALVKWSDQFARLASHAHPGVSSRETDQRRMTMAGRLQGKSALVTAAGQGMGRAAVMAFAREGARVIATDLKPELLASLPSGISTSPLDVLDDAAVQAFVERMGPVDILFNCAGYVHQGTILDCSVADWDFSFDLNVRSVFV